MNEIAFILGLIIHAFFFAMAASSISNDNFQFWPPPNRNTWQYHSLWSGVRALVLCIAFLIYSNNSTFALPHWLRFYFAMPGFIILFCLGSISAIQLGWNNTHGEASHFVTTGFYKYSRNPQYIFFSISFLLLGIWSASLKAFVLLLLSSALYLAAPFPEEKWLQKQYGKAYEEYKKRVPRYFPFFKHA